MVTASGPPDPDINEFAGPALKTPMPPPGHAYMRDRMEAEGYSFEFFQAVRLLERLAPDRAPIEIGRASCRERVCT